MQDFWFVENMFFIIQQDGYFQDFCCLVTVWSQDPCVFQVYFDYRQMVPEQYDWLRKDLAAVNRRWTIRIRFFFVGHKSKCSSCRFKWPYRVHESCPDFSVLLWVSPSHPRQQDPLGGSAWPPAFVLLLRRRLWCRSHHHSHGLPGWLQAAWITTGKLLGFRSSVWWLLQVWFGRTLLQVRRGFLHCRRNHEPDKLQEDHIKTQAVTSHVLVYPRPWAWLRAYASGPNIPQNHPFVFFVSHVINKHQKKNEAFLSMSLT